MRKGAHDCQWLHDRDRDSLDHYDSDHGILLCSFNLGCAPSGDDLLRVLFRVHRSALTTPECLVKLVDLAQGIVTDEQRDREQR